ncbi:MAG: molybdopterin-dependent oxidoreductase, partial [Actinomycetales bacterium]|nr:molybdopterin-dependent oxidoreductase [Actinomycetales bacterium]
VFLRLRKGATAGRTKVSAVAPFASSALQRMRGTLIEAAPGTEAEVLDALEADVVAGGIVLVGERLAEVPGALSAALRLVERTGARLAWIPRRIGERTGVEAGTLPGLLPGGRPVTDSAARVDTAAEWGVESLPATEGRDTAGILAAAAAGELSGLVLGGLELDDLPDPALAREALAGVDVVVSLETRASAVHELADVVLPVAVPSEKAGTYVNWEGRLRGFGQSLDSNAMSDYRVLTSLADELDVDLGLATADVVHAELAALGRWDGARAAAPAVAASPVVEVGPGQAVLATWRLMLDLGRGQDGEQFLAGTAKRPVARLSAATAEAVGVSDGEDLAVSTEHGTITLPALVTAMVDHVVWVPGNSPGSQVRATLRTGAGSVVSVARATAEVTA